MANQLTNPAKAVTTILIAMVIAMAMTSCKPRLNDSSKVINIDPDGWSYGEAVEADISPADSVADGRLAISLRHTNLYLYSNIWLEVTVNDSLGAVTDTLCLPMADPSGRWLGRGIGTDFQLCDTLPQLLRLHRPASARVRHIMRDDQLQGIEQIGISFTQAVQ